MKKYNYKKKSDTLCWNCARCYGGCSWSRFFQPVKGWKARQTTIKNEKSNKIITSYDVEYCPIFKSDRRIEE